MRGNVATKLNRGKGPPKSSKNVIGFWIRGKHSKCLWRNSRNRGVAAGVEGGKKLKLSNMNALLAIHEYPKKKSNCALESGQTLGVGEGKRQ